MFNYKKLAHLFEYKATKMWKSLALYSIFAAVVTSTRTYNNYKVFTIKPTTDEQVRFLQRLANREYNDYEFWSEPSVKSHASHLMVSPRKLSEFSRLMNVTQMDYRAYIEDVQALIDRQNPLASYKDSAAFSWKTFQTYEEINDWLDSLANKYKEIELVIGGKTYEGREIKGVKLSYGGYEKPGVFLEAGIHANEWLGPATATYILNELLTSQDPRVRALAADYDWYIFPIFNPDGYVYTFKEDRLWRKNRRLDASGCFGVDPNRNWDYQWMSGGASDNPCHSTYAGKYAFSEVETKTLSKYISSISDKLFAFISFHTFGQHLLLPYGHTLEHLDNYDELYTIGKSALGSLVKKFGTEYDIGNIPEVLYIDSGSSMDWVKGSLKLPITYTYELRDNGRYGFIPPASEIIPNAREILDSFLTLFKEAKRFGYPQQKESHHL